MSFFQPSKFFPVRAIGKDALGVAGHGVPDQNMNTVKPVSYTHLYTLGIIPLALQYEIVDGFTALGIARVAVTLSLNRKILYLVLTLLLPMVFGASGAFYAEPAVDMACGVISTIVFFLLFNRLMRQRDAMPDGQALYS